MAEKESKGEDRGLASTEQEATEKRMAAEDDKVILQGASPDRPPSASGKEDKNQEPQDEKKTQE